MATYDLTKKTYGVSGQSKVILGNTNNESGWKRLQNLENKVEEQSDKLDQITSLLNEISKKTSASWDNIWVQIWQICINKTDWWFKETIKWSRISYQKIIN